MSKQNPRSNSPLEDYADISYNPPALQNPSLNSILCIAFNQDRSCFACGFDDGFRLYTCDPFKETLRREISNGISVVEMLYCTNILALVCAKVDHVLRYPCNKVLIWDDNKRKSIGEFTYRQEIRSVRLSQSRILVVLLQKILVYNFTDFKQLHMFETVENPKGLCEISHSKAAIVLVFPGRKKGEVRIEHLDVKLNRCVLAHESEITCLAISPDGQLVASASTKGTLVRIFNTISGILLQEVRRGIDEATIYSMDISPNMQWLALSSDKITVHVFSLKPNSDEPSNTPCDPDLGAIVPKPFTSSPCPIKGVLPKYFSSERSFARFRLPECSKYIVGFGEKRNDTLLILDKNGSFYRCKFDPAIAGAMTLLECHKFLIPDQ